MIEHLVEFQSDVKLAGTLTLPENNGKFPAVLMLHGSGKVDRNENAKQLNLNVFKELATFFANHGIASLRYDKRGVGASEGNFLEAGLWELVKDAQSALQFLKAQPAIDSNAIILLGHSEGCSVAPAVNQRQPVNGMILLAGTSDSVLKASRWQAERIQKEVRDGKGIHYTLLRLLKIDKKILTKQEQLFDKINASEESVMKIGMRKINAKWFREHGQYQVSEDLPLVTCPTLVITGEKDVQVNPDDARKIAEKISGPSDVHIIPNMNHLLRKQGQPASLVSMKKVYKESVQKPIDAELLQIISVWLQNNFQMN